MALSISEMPSIQRRGVAAAVEFEQLEDHRLAVEVAPPDRGGLLGVSEGLDLLGRLLGLRTLVRRLRGDVLARLLGILVVGESAARDPERDHEQGNQ